MWGRYDHRLVVPPPGQGRVRPQSNVAVGNPPISGPGKPVPPIGGSIPTPPPPSSGWPGVANTTRGGHFYSALPPDISIPA